MDPQDQAPEDADLGQLLRAHLFEGDLLQLPAPEEGIPGFLPEWYKGTLPALVYPPLSERGVADGDNIDLQITPYNMYYGALRALTEVQDEEQGDALRRLVLEWNAQAAHEVCELGRAHIDQGDVATAVLHYELALELDDNLYEANQDAGMCHYALSTVEGANRDTHLDSAEELFRHALELRPESGFSCWSLARVLNDRGDAEAAEELMSDFLDDYPEGEEREMVEEALQHGFAAEEQSSEQELFAQAQVLAFGDDPARAVEMLQPLAEAFPDTGEIWFVLGAAHRRVGAAAEAERCLRRAARLVGEEPFVWWELARAYMDVSQWRAAEDALRKAVELDPQNAIYLCDLGRALLAQGDHEGAGEAIEQARELVPDDPEVLKAVEELRAASAQSP